MLISASAAAVAAATATKTAAMVPGHALHANSRGYFSISSAFNCSSRDVFRYLCTRAPQFTIVCDSNEGCAFYFSIFWNYVETLTGPAQWAVKLLVNFRILPVVGPFGAHINPTDS